MRIGQTSLVVFLSKLLSSILGFVATIYFARVLGAEIIGVYAAVIALTSWLAIGSTMGIDDSIKKRLSEGKERGQFLVAGIVSIGVLFLLTTLVVFLFRRFLEGYVEVFSTFVDISIVWVLIAILLSRLLVTITQNALQGIHLVHLTGVLQPVKIGSQSLFQIGLVFIGFGLVGMLVGHVMGLLVVVIISAYFIGIRPKLPEKRHFRRLIDYAKYAWVGTIKSKTFTNVDILVLEAFVATSLVGIYSIAWGIATFFNVFGGAITQAVFPEISNISSLEEAEATGDIIEDALAFNGFIIIPGLVGGLLLGDRVLRIYGPEFVQGTQVLALLLLSILFHSYMNQFLNALNAVDRPELPFRINGVFIAANLILNILLVIRLGWVGAAIASAASTGLGLVFGYRSLVGIVPIDLPLGEVARQGIAAASMGGVVWLLLAWVETTRITTHNFLIVGSLVLVGAGVYLIVMLGISSRFRATVTANLPNRLNIAN